MLLCGLHIIPYFFSPFDQMIEQSLPAFHYSVSLALEHSHGDMFYPIRLRISKNSLIKVYEDEE